MLWCRDLHYTFNCKYETCENLVHLNITQMNISSTVTEELQRKNAQGNVTVPS